MLLPQSSTSAQRRRTTDISFLIPSYNHFDVLTQAVQSIVHHTKDISYEIVIIDNNSPDGDILTQCKFDGPVRVFKNNCNAGWPSAINQGLGYARGRYICIVDNDVIYIENTAKKLRDFCDELGDEVVVGPRILHRDLTTQKSIHDFPTVTNLFFSAIMFNRLFPRIPMCNREHMNCVSIEETVKVQSLLGTCLFFPVTVARRLGGFDGGMFLNGDTDFCRRFENSGGTVLYNPKTSIVHLGSVSTNDSRFKGQDHLLFDLVRYCQKHHSRGERGAMYVFLFFSFVVRFVLWLVIGVFTMDKELIRKSLIFPTKIFFLVRGVMHHDVA